MASREEFKREVGQATAITIALVAALIFGIIIILTESDWIPGGIAIGAGVVGLSREIPVIRKLCSTELPPSPPTSRPVG
jgi:hypothetical protein